MAMSLPYGLMVLDDTDTVERESCLLIGIHENYAHVDYNDVGYEEFLIDVIDPILFPISCLTKEIQLSNYNEGKPFIPIEKLYHLNILRCDISNFQFINLDVVADHCFSNQFIKLFQQLIKWHIDIAGLIKSGEAISCTETFNPYK